jgi:predicted PurR-regulated permease PerM
MEMELLEKLENHIDEINTIKIKNQQWLERFEQHYQNHVEELKKERERLEQVRRDGSDSLSQFDQMTQSLEKYFKWLMRLAAIIIMAFFVLLYMWHESSSDEQAANDLNAYLRQKYGSIQTIHGKNYLKVRSANTIPKKLQDEDGEDLPGYYMKIN